MMEVDHRHHQQGWNELLVPRPQWLDRLSCVMQSDMTREKQKKQSTHKTKENHNKDYIVLFGFKMFCFLGGKATKNEGQPTRDKYFSALLRSQLFQGLTCTVVSVKGSITLLELPSMAIRSCES